MCAMLYFYNRPGSIRKFKKTYLEAIESPPLINNSDYRWWRSFPTLFYESAFPCLFCLKLHDLSEKKILGEDHQTPPPYNCNITKTLNNAKTINSNMFWRVENSGKRSYLWKDIALKAVTMAKLDFDHTYAEYTLKRPPSSFVFCLSNFSRRLDPLWRKFLDPRLSYIEQSLKTYPFIYWSFLKRFIYTYFSR